MHSETSKLQKRDREKEQGSQAVSYESVSITTVILLKQVAGGHDHLWIVCCWYSVMAGSVSVCANTHWRVFVFTIHL